jgi:hypothetical protein
VTDLGFRCRGAEHLLLLLDTRKTSFIKKILEESECHTRFSEENQVQIYMHARIKFHAYSDIKVYAETVSRLKKKDYQRFTLNPGNEGSKHHRQSTGGYVRLAPTTTSQDFRVASSF